MRADQAHEFIRAEREAAFPIHLPGEAQRQAARLRRRLAGKCFDRRRWRMRNGFGRGRLVDGGRFGKRIEQRKLGGRFARLYRLLVIGSRLRRDRLLHDGHDGCARLRGRL